MTDRRWRKSTRSQSSASCVELAHTMDAVRDSKNPGGPVLQVGITPLITDLKHDRLQG